MVTITTSGCPSAPNRSGLCERCALLAAKIVGNGKSDNTAATPMSPEVVSAPPQLHLGTDDGSNGNRRYTKVSLQYSSGGESGSTDLTSSASSSSHHPATSYRQASNSSSASLEALSRRGSNPESENRGEFSAGGSMLGNSLNQLSASSSISQQLVHLPTCIRSCTGWAEILVRRPTGNVSWIMRIQNPIGNDCFGLDMPFSNMINLFLPTSHGGVFGPDYVEDVKVLSPKTTHFGTSPLYPTFRDNFVGNEDQSRSNASRARALQRQEEVTSVSSTGPIDIPMTSKRSKETLPGSVSDGEADEDDAAFDSDGSRSRNPVRRVNSSPEMTSSWKNPFLTTKPAPLSNESMNPSQSDFYKDREDYTSLTTDQQLKKKSVSYTKDMRVSCEAIPEEIAGSTPPSQAESVKDDEDQKQNFSADKDQSAGQKTFELISRENILPPKQHSADDVTNHSIEALSSGAPVAISASATSLKIPSESTTKIISKPPVSPAPLSPRLIAKNAAIKTASFSSNVGMAKAAVGINISSEYGGTDMIRGRSKTISVIREVNGKARPTPTFRFGVPKPQVNSKLAVNPSFVFMQLYHTGQQQVTDVPLKLTQEHMNVLPLLDLAPPYETHAIGVLYVGPGQCNNEGEILRNCYGSVRYIEFLRSIGTLVSLKDAKENNFFITMDVNGSDGKFTYVWKDDVMQVTFHVATLMPTNKEKDPNCNEKKKYIGNDYVSIVYNESGDEYNLGTISVSWIVYNVQKTIIFLFCFE